MLASELSSHRVVAATEQSRFAAWRAAEGYAKLFLKNSRAMMAVMVSGKVCRGLR